MHAHQQNRKPALFFILTFLYSWGIWLPSILTGLGVDLGLDGTAYTAVTVPIGAFAPLFAAITLVVKQHGWKEAGRFLRQVFDFKVKPIFIILALGIPIVIHAIAHYLAPALGFEVANTLLPENLPVSPLVLSIPYFFLMLLIGGGQEEFGWRGYALDPLQERLGVIPASLLIGLIWGIWHLPLWVMPGDGHSTYPFLAFLIMTTSISVVYSWLYNASNKKLIVALLFHAMSNTAAPLLPFLLWEEGKPENGYWVYAGVNVVAALIAFVFIKRQKRT
ncbi:MAG: type II CAAX endopeptidase family protein, partial [Chloroflexota bacterium]